METCKGCKHYKRDERIGIKCCEFGLHESYCEKDKEDFAITELEKIKADLQKLSDDEWNQQVGADKGLELAIEVIEDRIAELKRRE